MNMADGFIPMRSIDLKSILVATDLSESADKALEHGIAIARHYHATLYVVYVVSSIGFTLAGPDVVELAAQASERDINCLVNQLVDSGKLRGVEVWPVVLKGNMDEQVESFARAHRVDLIVIGSHGRCGLARALFGSVAELISKSCSCPVLTVGPHSPGPWLDDPADAGKPLLLATAFNSASVKAVPYAISLANDFDRQLFVLHVNPPQNSHLVKKDCTAHSDYESSALAQLGALITDSDHKCSAKVLVESCDPADGILHVAKRIHAVTIIMGAHRGSIADLTTRLPGSISNQLNREAMCPVLTVGG